MNRAAVLGSLALMLVACSSVAAPSGPSAATASEVTSPIPSPTVNAPAPSTTPPVTANGPRITWSEVPFEGRILDIIGDGTRFVAVGSGASGTSAWTSGDGDSWTEHDVPERSFGEVSEDVELTASMGTLVRLGDTLYSFGGMSFMDSVQGVGWRWPDGSAWDLISSESDFFGGSVTAVAAGQDALLAAGISFETGLYGTTSTWRWTSATSWVRTPLSSSVEGEISVGALAWADGTYLAAGSSASPVDGAQPWDWPRELSMWTSADGIDWTPAQLPQGMSSVCTVASANGGFVAFGTANDRVAAWTSADGATWFESLVDAPDVQAGTDDFPIGSCGVVDAGGALVAVAPAGDSTLVWTSRDGDRWTFQESLEMSTGPLAALGRQVLLAGSRDDSQVVLLGVLEP